MSGSWEWMEGDNTVRLGTRLPEGTAFATGGAPASPSAAAGAWTAPVTLLTGGPNPCGRSHLPIPRLEGEPPWAVRFRAGTMAP